MAPTETNLDRTTHASPGMLPSLDQLRDERFVSSYLGVSAETLRSWRKKGVGPRFKKLGACVRYPISDLIAFVESRPTGGGGALGPSTVASGADRQGAAA
jgi:hypothetical protein